MMVRDWVLAVHVLCAVIWVGGMFFAYVVLRPSVAVLEPIQRIALHTQVFRRFFLVIWHAMPLILLSGFTVLLVFDGGPAVAGWNVNLMMLLGLIMSAVFLLIVFGPYARFRRTTDRNTAAASMDRIRKLTTEAKEIIAWAMSRYRAAGLQLPDLTVSFPSFCEGRSALYHVGERSIEFCQITRLNALHEFAHAWDDTSGAVDREAFLKLRGLKVWFGGLDLPSREQGCEQLANIIAWGLMDADARGVPDFTANSVSELTKAFIMLTGGVTPRQTVRVATYRS
jgi:uncharacterized membrane protein